MKNFSQPTDSRSRMELFPMERTCSCLSESMLLMSSMRLLKRMRSSSLTSDDRPSIFSILLNDKSVTTTVTSIRLHDVAKNAPLQPLLQPFTAFVRDGNWTTRGYANSRIANSRTGQVADWTTRGLADAAKRTKTKHAKSPVASASCSVRDLSSPRVD